MMLYRVLELYGHSRCIKYSGEEKLGLGLGLGYARCTVPICTRWLQPAPNYLQAIKDSLHLYVLSKYQCQGNMRYFHY